MNNEISKIIIENREKLKISRRELAKKIGIDHNYLARIEKGIIKKPSIKILFNISKELKIDFQDLLLKTYDIFELERLESFKSIINVINLDPKVVEKVEMIDKNKNIRISLLKILNLYKENSLNINETICLLSCLTNKNMYDYLTEDELNIIKKEDNNEYL